MPIFELTTTAIREIPTTTFSKAKVLERSNLQRLLRDHIDVIAPRTMVITEEFGEWDESRRRIDLLGLDDEANLVVIELKRTEDGGHMELQAIRYAAMISTMTFKQVVDVHRRYLEVRGIDDDAERRLLEFLGWDEPDEEQFAQSVRIVLASAEFSKELTTSVLWLNEQTLDIRCVRLRPHEDGGHVLLDVQQVIPLPEAEQYQIQVREKARREKESRASGLDLTKYDVTIDGNTHIRLPKRRALLVIVKHLSNRSVTPQQMCDSVSYRKNAFWSVDGTITDSETFIEKALVKAQSLNRAFDQRRYFLSETELIHAGEKTYALSNQWGGRGIAWINQILEKCGEHGVTIAPASEGSCQDNGALHGQE